MSVNSSNTNMVIPTVGTLAIGAQKLLPYMQQTYGSWTSLIGASASIAHVLKMIELPIDNNYKFYKPNKILFQKNIITKDLSLKYADSKNYVFKNLNLIINRGDIVGILGKSGSGKSSFADVFMGLIKPTDGFIKVDGINIYDAKFPSRYMDWRNSITHVPQNIFLIDSTIIENITFNTNEEFDFKKVKDAAKKARIDKYIESLPNGYYTHVGENGVKLSGGQRQRIGIARALYKESEVLIFDEPTSALDQYTEDKIIKTIYNLKGLKTILIISHRVSSLKDCDKLIEFNSIKI